MKISQKGFAALLVVVLQAALLPIALQVGGSGIGIIQFLLYTSIIAAVTCITASYFDDRLNGFFSLFRSRKTFAIVLAAALLGYPITLLLFNIGVIGTNSSIGGIVWRSWVLMLAMMTPFVLKQRVSFKGIAALLIGFIGVSIAASNGGILSISAGELPYVLALLVSGFAIAASIVAVKGRNISTTGFVAFAT